VRFNGCYAFVSYFLTGEHRPYKRSTGAFDQIKPHENFFRVRAQDGCVHTGKGAWEFAYRFSYIDLNDEGILGGRAHDHTLGLNWYLNPYTRVMFNYVNSTLDTGIDGTLDVFEMRAQIDF
jgi:phosphate-selective porin OprO/OprP